MSTKKRVEEQGEFRFGNEFGFVVWFQASLRDAALLLERNPAL